MTPGTLNIPIYRGAKWEHLLSFVQDGTTTPIDLTGLGPFVMDFKDISGNLITTAEVTVDDPTTGEMVVTLTADQTLLFTLGGRGVTAGIRDALNNPYAQGILDVSLFTPDPS